MPQLHIERIVSETVSQLLVTITSPAKTTEPAGTQTTTIQFERDRASGSVSIDIVSSGPGQFEHTDAKALLDKVSAEALVKFLQSPAPSK